MRRNVLTCHVLDQEADIGLAADTHAHVLITAQPDVAVRVARAVHEGSARRHLPFVVALEPGVGDLARALCDAEGGTLVVCGIDTLSRTVQQELRCLVESTRMTVGGSPNRGARLITSSATVLAAKVRAGEFDEGLFYRLNCIHLCPAET